MLQEEHAPSRLEDANPLRHRFSVVGDGAEGKAEHHGVEPLIGELEHLSIALSQIHIPAEFRRALPRLCQHGRAQVDSRHAGVRSVEGQVQPRADSDLEHVSAGPGADPPAPLWDRQNPLPEPQAPVVLGSKALVVDAHALGR